MDFAQLLSGAAGVASGNPFSLLSTFGGFFAGGVPDHERSDLQKIAANYLVSEDQAAKVCSYRESHDRANYDAIVKHAASDSSFWSTILAEYNAARPGAPVVPSYGNQYAAGQIGIKIPTAEDIYAGMYQAGVPLGVPISVSGTATAGLGSALTSQDLKNIGTGILNGGIAGGKNAIMDTDEGKAAKADAIAEYVKEYQLPIAAGVGGILWLAYKAFNK